MTVREKTQITVDTIINAPIDKVWELWAKPEHITQWNQASDEWHTPRAENDLKEGGHFLYRMEAKDGSMGFDFSGVYDEVRPNEYVKYTLDDGRKVTVEFKSNGNETLVVETFEAEETHSVEMQKSGWQAILNQFKKYAESIS